MSIENRNQVRETKKSSLEKVKEWSRNCSAVNEELVTMNLDVLSKDVQEKKEDTFQKELESFEKNIPKYQQEVDNLMKTLVGTKPETFREKWAEFSKLNDEKKKAFLTDPENLWFVSGTENLIQQTENFLKAKEPGLWQKIEDRFSQIPDKFEQGMNTGIDPSGAWLGILGMYAATYKENYKIKGPKTMLKGFAIGAAAGMLPMISVPVLHTLKSTAESIGDIARPVGSVAVNSILFFARGGQDAEFLIDGKWKSSRTQEALKKNIHEIENKTREFVPESMAQWYNKILDKRGAGLTKEEIFSAADYCVKSLDDDVFLSEKEFEKIAAKIKNNQWKTVEPEELYRMLNTAYANKTLEFFLSLPKTHLLRKDFESRFSSEFTKRQEAALTGLVQDKLNLKGMYGEKITTEIKQKQYFGIAGDMYHGGLKSVLSWIMAAYAAFAGVSYASGKLRKNKEDNEKEKREKNADRIPQKQIEKIETAFAKPKPRSSDVGKVLSALVAGDVITKSLDKELSGVDPNAFFKALKEKGFVNGLSSKPLSQSFQEFREAMNSVPTKVEQLAKINEQLDKADLVVNYNSLEKRLKNGTIDSLYVYVADPKFPKDKTKIKLFSLTNLKKKQSISGIAFESNFDGKSDLNFSFAKSRTNEVSFKLPRNVPTNIRVEKGEKYEVLKISFEKKSIVDATVEDVVSGKTV